MVLSQTVLKETLKEIKEFIEERVLYLDHDQEPSDKFERFFGFHKNELNGVGNLAVEIIEEITCLQSHNIRGFYLPMTYVKEELGLELHKHFNSTDSAVLKEFYGNELNKLYERAIDTYIRMNVSTIIHGKFDVEEEQDESN